jgi:hypothetical protein
MAEDAKVKWEPRISLGNLLTIGVMLMGGAGVFVRMDVGDARQDERISAMERRVTALEVTRISSADRLATELSQINTRLSKIEGFLQRPPGDGRRP